MEVFGLNARLGVHHERWCGAAWCSAFTLCLAKLTMAARIEPYKVHISDEALSKLQEQLKTARMAKATYEQMTSARYFGMRNERLGQLREYWQSGFDWRKQEAKLNQVAHFMAHLPQKDGSVFRMHFIHERSDHPDAVPILLLHGWPVCLFALLGSDRRLM